MKNQNFVEYKDKRKLKKKRYRVHLFCIYLPILMEDILKKYVSVKYMMILKLGNCTAVLWWYFITLKLFIFALSLESNLMLTFFYEKNTS